MGRTSKQQEIGNLLLPDELIQSKKFNKIDLAILHKLVFISNLDANKSRNCGCFASYATLMDMSSSINCTDHWKIKTKNEVKRSLEKLQRLGYVVLVCKGTRKGGASEYEIHLDGDGNSERCTQDSTQVGTQIGLNTSDAQAFESRIKTLEGRIEALEAQNSQLLEVIATIAKSVCSESVELQGAFEGDDASAIGTHSDLCTQNYRDYRNLRTT